MKGTLILVLFLTSGNLPLFAEDSWSTHQAREYKVQFDLPSQWETEADQDEDTACIESTSPDESMALMVCLHKGDESEGEELFQEAVKELGITLKGSAQQEKIHGLDAWIAEGTGKIYDEEAGILIMTATHENHDYVIYAFSDPSSFEKNEAAMKKILESVRPIEE